MGSRFECVLHRSGAAVPPFADCSAADAHTVSDLADGTYVFSARAVDPYGNIDATPASRRFTVDTGAPQTWFRAGPRGVVRVAGRTARATSG